MRDMIDKAVSLGFGIAAASKEQVEKLVDELVKKGEMTKKESPAYISELMAKGEEARNKVETMVRDRVQATLRDWKVATREDIERLERRLEALEKRSNPEGENQRSLELPESPQSLES
ncbi:phasin family protein [Paenibacillus sp. MBLB4367]|uniref:phasin family protein n=1 Tax=Paenibacillus sp. MBLB4367 TaxID=3384767 RepID=UPI0039081276